MLCWLLATRTVNGLWMLHATTWRYFSYCAAQIVKLQFQLIQTAVRTSFLKPQKVNF